MIALVHFTSNNLHVHSFQRALSAIVVLCTVLFKSGLTLTTASPDMLTRMTRESFLAHLLVNHRTLTVNGNEQGFVRFEQQHFCSVTGRQTSPCSTNFFPKSQREFNVVASPQQQTLSEKVCHLYEDCESIMKFVHTPTRFPVVQNLGNFHTHSNTRAHEDHGIFSERSCQDDAVNGHHMKRKDSKILDLSFATLHDSDEVYNVYNKKWMFMASSGRFSSTLRLIFRLMTETISSHICEKIRFLLHNKNTNERTLKIDSELSENVFSTKNIFSPTQCNCISVCLRQSITPNRSTFILMEIQPQQSTSDIFHVMASILDIPEFFLKKFCSFTANERTLQTLEQKQWEQCSSSYNDQNDEIFGSSALDEPNHDSECDPKNDRTMDEGSAEAMMQQHLPTMTCEMTREKIHRRGLKKISFPAAAMQQRQAPATTYKNLLEIFRSNQEVMAIFIAFAKEIFRAAAAERSAGKAARRATSSSESLDSKSKASNSNKNLHEIFRSNQEVMAIFIEFAKEIFRAAERSAGKAARRATSSSESLDSKPKASNSNTPERIQMRFGNVNHELVWFNSCVQGFCQLPAAYLEENFASKAHSLHKNRIDVHRLSSWIRMIAFNTCFHSVSPKNYQDDKRFSSPFSSYFMKQVDAIPMGHTLMREKSIFHATPTSPGRHGSRRQAFPIYMRKPNAVASRHYGLHIVMYARSSPTVT